MAITYKWDIPQMNAHIEAEGEQNVIYTVHWRYSGSDDYTVMGVWKVSRSWVKFMPQGKNRHKWAAGGGAKGAYFNWIAFEPIHGRNENSVDEDEES